MIAVIVMFFSFDVSLTELWEYITKAGYWLAAILGLWCVLYLMNAWAWRVIIQGGGPCTVGFMQLLKLTVSGFALNYATPVGLLGGEAYRIMELSKYIGVQRATSSVILFAMMHIFAHFWFWVTGVVAYWVLALTGDVPMNSVMGIVLGLITAFCWCGIYLFIKGYKNGMTVKLVRLLSKVPGLRSWGGRFMEHHLEDLQKIDRQIAELQNQNKRSFFGSFVLEYVGRFCQSFEIFFMLVLFGIDGERIYVDVFPFLSDFGFYFALCQCIRIPSVAVGRARGGLCPVRGPNGNGGRHRYVCKYYQPGAGIVLGFCRAVADEGRYRSVCAGRE